MPEGTEATAAAEVVEEVRVDGAAVAAEAAVGAVIAKSTVVEAAVEEVRTDLAAHAETSEERHEEILESGEWQRRTLESLLTMQQALQAQVTALQTLVTAELEAIRAELRARSGSQDLTPSTPSQPEQAVIQAEVINVEEAAEGRESQSQTETPPKRKRPVL
jgi:hypothetical protein